MLEPGIYERVVDRDLDAALGDFERTAFRVEERDLDKGDSASALAAYVARALQRYLSGFPEDERVARQVQACNDILLRLGLPGTDGEAAALSQAAVAEPGRLLTGVSSRLLGARPLDARPDTPVAQGYLFTGATDPSLASQLAKEFASADRVDILCSFIKWSGVRILADEIRGFLTQRPGDTAAPTLRVITTSYIGATDPEAVEFLSKLPGADVKVSYDTERTRLHAKAYIFHRRSGFGTAYIGSSNLTRPAMGDGLEWNVKISQYESVPLWRKIAATFETYWNDDDFAVCSDDAAFQRLRAAIDRERGRSTNDASVVLAFDVRPYPFQEEILARLASLRAFEDRHRHLVVAATGTGKTVVAGFDYAAFLDRRHRDRERANLLFVAHREEILRQSRDTFRGILQDQNFGDLCVGGHEPRDWNHLFVSIQTLHRRRLWENFAPDHWDYVVIDEFHHASAPLYQGLIARVQPVELLGLTATPERHDGENVLDYFGGEISAEIRLPDAIRRRLLCPFQYFGIPDTADLRRLTWRRGYIASELEHVLANRQRAGHVLNETQKKVSDLRDVRGIGFCASVRHAEFMAQFFREHGVPAMALSGETPSEERRAARELLEHREVNLLFVVDLYNEGVDLPFVDTILFLRPTESLTVFLQQFGRGLRIHRDKEYLTVLDFIGQAHEKYNFEPRFRALMDRPRHHTAREIENGCANVPPGCTVQLEPQARAYVLANIQNAVTAARRQLISRLASFVADTGNEPTLGGFLSYYELPPDDLYRRGSWTNLCAAARVRETTDPESALLGATDATKGIRRLAHWCGPNQLSRTIDLLQRLAADAPNVTTADPEDILLRRMLHVSLWGTGGPPTVAAGLELLRRNPDHLSELIDLLQIARHRLASVPEPLHLPYPCPLELHARYTQGELLMAVGHWRPGHTPLVQSGVLSIPDKNTDVLMVTLQKTEADFSPTTMYEDYAIDAHTFHWQSQSTTSETSLTGRRYAQRTRADGGVTLLFVREVKENDNRLTEPYWFFGPVDYLEHSGSRPMSVKWRLQHAIPAHLLPAARRAAP